MAIQDDIMTAKQQAQSSIPVYVVPNQPGGQRPNYGDELAGRSGPGVHQYSNMGKSVYAPFAPGTQTLASKQFDETKRSNLVAEDLAAKQFEENKRARAVAEAISASKAAAGGGSSSAKSTIGERVNESTSEMLKAAGNIYNDLAKKTKKPLATTIQILLTDRELQEYAIADGINQKAVVDAMIRSKMGPNYASVDDYFKESPEGQALSKLYYGTFGYPKENNQYDDIQSIAERLMSL